MNNIELSNQNQGLNDAQQMNSNQMANENHELNDIQQLEDGCRNEYS